MADSVKSGAGKEDIEDQIKTIRKDVTELTNLLRSIGVEKLDDVSKAARAKTDEWVQKSKESVHQAGRTVKAKAVTVEDYIIEKPLQAAIIAFLIGLFIGSISRR